MTHMDKLKAAFDELNSLGVVAYHNFWCCGGCASGGAANNYDAQDAETKARQLGAVFYHEQEAERATEGGGLGLHYGAFPHETATSDQIREVGLKITKVLHDHGLGVKWNGDPFEVIEIPNFTATLDEIPQGEGSTLHDRDRDEEVVVIEPDEGSWDDAYVYYGGE